VFIKYRRLPIKLRYSVVLTAGDVLCFDSFNLVSIGVVHGLQAFMPALYNTFLA
jgi:hypothetical protein